MIGRPLLAALFCLSGCATSQYGASYIAHGELIVHYQDGISLAAGDRPIANSPRFDGLADFVRCVPAAHQQARAARKAGTAGLVLSILGGSLGGLGAAGLVGLTDSDRRWQWLSSGLALAVSGAVLASVGRLLRVEASGRAIDATNFYNDAVGSVGKSCAAP